MTIPKDSYAFIDGSFNPDTYIYGCGGFLIDQFGKKHIIQAIGKDPELAKMRNVAGELLGARKAMELAKKLKMRKLTIFHDYEGIANWPNKTWKANKPATKSYVRFVSAIMAPKHQNARAFHFRTMRRHKHLDQILCQHK